MPETPAFPRRLTLELTNRCNYSCVMCPSRWRPELARGDMDPALFRRIADEAAEHAPVAVVPFFRGESLLHPQAAQLLAHAKARGLGPIQLASNGALLTPELGRALLDLGLDFISFSLDSDDPAEYADIRRGGELGRVKRNVLEFIAARDQGGYATQVQVSATRTAHNSGGIDRFVARWRDVADRTRIYYEHSADGHSGSLDAPELSQPMARQACHKPFEDMVVYYDGGAALCNHDWFRSPALGDLDSHTVAQVWHGPAYEALRAQHQNPERLTDETCLHCDHWRLCHLPGGMIGELYTKEGDDASTA